MSKEMTQEEIAAIACKKCGAKAIEHEYLTFFGSTKKGYTCQPCCHLDGGVVVSFDKKGAWK